MKPRRSSDVMWRDEPAREAEALRLIQEGEDFSGVGVVTLAVEDEISQLNLVGAAIWRLCDGQHDIDQMVERLRGRFDVPAVRLRGDVEAFVQSLAARGWLVEGE